MWIFGNYEYMQVVKIQQEDEHCLIIVVYSKQNDLNNRLPFCVTTGIKHSVSVVYNNQYIKLTCYFSDIITPIYISLFKNFTVLFGALNQF